MVGVALAVGGVGLVAFLQRSQVHSLDSGAALRAADVAALIQSRTLPARLPIQGQETSLVQVVDESGRVIASSANIEGEARIAGFPTAGVATIKERVNAIALASEDDFRRGRTGVLQGFSQRDRLFRLERMRRQFEERARHNLTREIARLTGG